MFSFVRNAIHSLPFPHLQSTKLERMKVFYQSVVCRPQLQWHPLDLHLLFFW